MRKFIGAVGLPNWFGLNAPAIAAAEAEYEQMWAQDVAAMVGCCADASAVAAQLTPFQRLLPTLRDQTGASAQAADPVPDVALSVFGTTLFRSGSVHAFSDAGGVAFSFGADSNATANPITPGFGSLAPAIGNNDTAIANGTLCTATLLGNNSSATGASAAPPPSTATTLRLRLGPATTTTATSPSSPAATARPLLGPRTGPWPSATPAP
ncbi:hypothetical protein MLAC_14760 [Mycobacterium lacus]|uniref:PPE domain-containing protein n=1 Tax=Mycobacterium lacus TaxID=169765 RepID=A0A7I7NHR0_9MYCO|nr:PPE domain-containing protein [Mycobacterium lacus]BBX96182.1 hypothetical protein MLAC_14760 [Mycobacterium lacus]